MAREVRQKQSREERMGWMRRKKKKNRITCDDNALTLGRWLSRRQKLFL